MKPSIAKQIMKSVLNGGNTPFLLGGTGVGKSAVVRQVADELADDKEVIVDAINPNSKQFGFIDFRLSLYETVDLGGLPYIDDAGGQKRAFLGNLPTKGEGLLFFDEYPQASPSVQAVIGQLIYEKRLGEYVLPKGWKIICAGNRVSDRASSNKLPSHVIGRVALIDFEHNVDDWINWANKNNVHEDVIGFISQQPQALLEFDPKIVEPQPSPRTWTALSDTLKVMQKEDTKYLQQIARTHVGEIQSHEFATWISLFDTLPNLQDIFNGKEVEVLDRAGECYACCVALWKLLNNRKDDSKVYDYFENSLAYIKKFSSPEFSIFFVRQCVSSNEDLKDTSAYNDFKVENQNLEY
jgi:MoxR-like ATPase